MQPGETDKDLATPGARPSSGNSITSQATARSLPDSRSLHIGAQDACKQGHIDDATPACQHQACLAHHVSSADKEPCSWSDPSLCCSPGLWGSLKQVLFGTTSHPISLSDEESEYQSGDEELRAASASEGAHRAPHPSSCPPRSRCSLASLMWQPLHPPPVHD